MEVPVHNLAGEVVKHITLSDKVFAVPFNEAVVHQAVTRQRANTRQGTSSTKTRGEVSGTGRKLFRQKHTGFARAGSCGGLGVVCLCCGLATTGCLVDCTGFSAGLACCGGFSGFFGGVVLVAGSVS